MHFRFLAASTVVAIVGTAAAPASAQEPRCQPERTESLRIRYDRADDDSPAGNVVLNRCPLASQVLDGDDYGGVHVYFEPPKGEIPGMQVGDGWFERLVSDKEARVLTMVQVDVCAPSLGPPGCAPAARVPLVEYVRSRGPSGFAAADSSVFADRLVTPRFRIERDMNIRVIVSFMLTSSTKSQIVSVLQPLAMLAGGAASTVLSGGYLREVEERISSRLGTTQISDVSVFDLHFAQGANELVYDLRLAPPSVQYCRRTYRGDDRQRCKEAVGHPAHAGRLEVSLDRRPSMIVDQMRAPGYPDYLPRGAGTPDLERIKQVPINAPEHMTVHEFVLDRAPDLAAFGSLPATTRDLDPNEFRTLCTRVREAIFRPEGSGGMPLSIHDRFAVYFAILTETNQLDRPAIRNTDCIQRDISSFERYGFRLPDLAPPVNANRARDFWTEFEAVLAQAPSDDRQSRLRRLFAGDLTDLYARKEDGFSTSLSGAGRVDTAVLLLRPLLFSAIGCQRREDSGTITGLARLSFENAPSEGRLFVLSLGLAEVGGQVVIDAFRIEAATPHNFAQFAQWFAGSRCGTLETALIPAEPAAP